MFPLNFSLAVLQVGRILQLRFLFVKFFGTILSRLSVKIHDFILFACSIQNMSSQKNHKFRFSFAFVVILEQRT